MGDIVESIPTRQSLLSRLRHWDDHGSWKDFFDTYWRLIYGVAINAGLSDAEAQDVVQETVISVAKTAPEFKYQPEKCSFKGWLRHVTEKRIVDQFRKRQREASARGIWNGDGSEDARLEQLPAPESSRLEHFWEQEWEKNLIDAALEKLQLEVSAMHYQIFYLHVIREMPVSEVAAAVGVSIGQVYLIKHRLSRSFKKALRKLEQ